MLKNVKADYPNLRWKPYVDALSKRLSPAIFNIRVLSRCSGTQTVLNVYHSYFISHIRYGVIFWGGTKSHMNSMFGLQKEAIRVMSGAKWRQSCRPLFRKLSLLTMPAIYVYELALFYKRNEPLFEAGMVTHGYATRNRTKIPFPIHNLTLLEKGPYYSAIRVIDALPPSIKGLKEQQFKIELRRKLTEEVPYTVSDCLVVLREAS